MEMDEPILEQASMRVMTYGWTISESNKEKSRCTLTLRFRNKSLRLPFCSSTDQLLFLWLTSNLLAWLVWLPYAFERMHLASSRLP